MSSIITITLNPCIDKSASIASLKPEKKLRCSKPKYEAGGGGINVSRAIRKLGGDSIPIFPAGSYTGTLLTDLLIQENIHPVIINIKEYTRENFMVVDEATNNQYRFCMPGPVLEESEWHACLKAIELIKDAEYIVASGSLPPGAPVDIFGRIAQISKSKGAKFILDTSGEPLKHALEQGVYLWKPNSGELSALSGTEELTTETAIQAAKKIIAEKKSEIIVVSLGAAGAILITENITQRFNTPLVKRRSTVGAGDSMVAGIVLSLLKNKSLPDAVLYGVMCGTAATMNPGTELCRLEDVEQLYNNAVHL